MQDQMCAAHNQTSELFCPHCCRFLCPKCTDPHFTTDYIIHKSQIIAMLHRNNCQQISAIKEKAEELMNTTINAIKQKYNQLINNIQVGIASQELFDKLSPTAQAMIMTAKKQPESTQKRDYEKATLIFIRMAKEILCKVNSIGLDKFSLHTKSNEASDENILNYLKNISGTIDSKEKKYTMVTINTLQILHNAAISPVNMSALYDQTLVEYYKNEKQSTFAKEAYDSFKSNLDDLIDSMKYDIPNEDKALLSKLFNNSFLNSRNISLLNSRFLNAIYIGKLNKWIGYEGKYNIIYRASRDGFTAQQFHSKCNGKAPTVCICKTNYGKTIGGYTPIPWDSTSNTYKADTTLASFLFSMDANKKYKLCKDYQKMAIFSCSSYIILFGSNNLFINDNCYIENSCQGDSMSGCYETESNYNFGGANRFSIEDFEVFEVDK